MTSRARVSDGEASLLAVLRKAPVLPPALLELALVEARQPDGMGPRVLAALLRREEVDLDLLHPLVEPLSALERPVFKAYLCRPEHTPERVTELVEGCGLDMVASLARMPLTARVAEAVRQHVRAAAAVAQGDTAAVDTVLAAMLNMAENHSLPLTCQAQAVRDYLDYLPHGSDPAGDRRDLVRSLENRRRGPLPDAVAEYLTTPDLIDAVAYAVTTQQAADALAAAVLSWEGDLLETEGARAAAYRVAGTVTRLGSATARGKLATWLEHRRAEWADDARFPAGHHHSRISELRATHPGEHLWSDSGRGGADDTGPALELAAHVVARLGNDAGAWTTLLAVGREFHGTVDELLDSVLAASAPASTDA